MKLLPATVMDSKSPCYSTEIGMFYASTTPGKFIRALGFPVMVFEQGEAEELFDLIAELKSGPYYPCPPDAFLNGLGYKAIDSKAWMDAASIIDVKALFEQMEQESDKLANVCLP